MDYITVIDSEGEIRYLCPSLLQRLGSLVVLPYLGETAFWYEKGIFEQRYYGHHGGLTPEEMLIPLLASEI